MRTAGAPGVTRLWFDVYAQVLVRGQEAVDVLRQPAEVGTDVQVGVAVSLFPRPRQRVDDAAGELALARNFSNRFRPRVGHREEVYVSQSIGVVSGKPVGAVGESTATELDRVLLRDRERAVAQEDAGVLRAPLFKLVRFDQRRAEHNIVIMVQLP